MDGVLDVGLDPLTAWALQLRGRGDHTTNPSRVQRPREPEPGGTGLIRRRDRTRELPDPGLDVVMGWGQPRLEQLARGTVDRGRRDRSCVHIEPHTRTLRK